jgi:ADP-ribosylation factor-like protein 2
VAAAIGVAELRSGRRHVHMVRCSAVTGEGLLDGMEWITKDVSSRIYMN